MTEKLRDLLAVVATIDPDANTAAAYSTDYIDMTIFQEVLFIVMAGEIAASGTIDFKVQEATSATGAGAQDLATGTLSITQLTTGDNDEQTLVDVEAEDLSTGFTHVKGVMTVTTAAADSAVVALGSRARFNPASDNDLASVGEILG